MRTFRDYITHLTAGLDGVVKWYVVTTGDIAICLNEASFVPIESGEQWQGRDENFNLVVSSTPEVPNDRLTLTAQGIPLR